MIFFPFRSKVYKTSLSSDQIFNRLLDAVRSHSSGPEEKNSILEMSQESSSFVIGKSKDAAKHGLMDTEPVMKGKLKAENGFTHVRIAIRPRSFLLPIIGVLVIIPSVYFGVTKFDFLTFLLALLLVIMIYSDLVVKFNRWYGAYLEILERVFQEDTR